MSLSVSSVSTIQIPDREPGLLTKVRANSASRNSSSGLESSVDTLRSQTSFTMFKRNGRSKQLRPERKDGSMHFGSIELV